MGTPLTPHLAPLLALTLLACTTDPAAPDAGPLPDARVRGEPTDARPTDATLDRGPIPFADVAPPLDAAPDAAPDATPDAAPLPPDAGPPLPPGDLVVYITDPRGYPLPGARVTALDHTTATDLDGRAQLAGLPPGPATLHITAPGHADAAPTLEISPRRGTRLVHRLAARSASQTIDPTLGGAPVFGPVRVNIPPDAIVDAAGDPVDTPVTVTVAHVDPTTDDALLPGPALALDVDTPTPLASLGALEVTLWRGDEPLALAPDTTVHLDIPIPTAWHDRVRPGDPIPGWWFDPDRALWIWGGNTAHTFNDNGRLALRLPATRLAWWSIGHPTPAGCLDVTVLDADDQPAPDAHLTLRAPALGYRAAALTDADGRACAPVIGPARLEASATRDLYATRATAVDIADDPPAACGHADCTPLTLRLEPPGCLRIDPPRADGAFIAPNRPGAPPARLTPGDPPCAPVPNHSSFAVAPALNGAPDHAHFRRVHVERPGACAQPPTCARVELHPRAPARPLTGRDADLYTVDAAGRGLTFADTRAPDGASRPLPPHMDGPLATLRPAGPHMACALGVDARLRCVGHAPRIAPWLDDPLLPTPTLIDLPLAGPGAAAVVDHAHQPGRHCVILADTTAQCWGQSFWPWTLTDPDSDIFYRVAELALRGDERLCLRQTDGAVHCGEPPVHPRSRITPLDLGASAAQLVAHDHATCARLTDGHVTCWGRAGYTGHPADGDAELPPAPVETAPGEPLTDVVDLAAARGAACALTADQQIWCWGTGALGRAHPTPDAITSPHATPVDLSLFDPLPPIAALHVGGPLACAVFTDRTATCWGQNPTLHPPEGEAIYLFDPQSDPARPAPDRVFALDRLGDR